MTEMRAAPYPADTRAKGWRFEVDLEKVKQSDTWLRAKSGIVRGALLLLWAEAWQQKPCGTLPNDDELVALLIDMAPVVFTKHRSVLMRGWWLASDGRLYHDTIADRVLEMLAKKEKDRARKAGWRARQSDGVTPPPDGVPLESRGTDKGPTPDSGRKDITKHQAPSTSTREEKRDTPPAARVPPEPSARATGKRALRKCPADFVVSLDLQVWAQDKAHGVDLAAETEKFRDWTFNTARTDWDGTWRNWMRKAAQDIGSRVPAGARHGGSTGNRQEAQEERNRAAMASWLENEGVQQ